ncbi:NOS1 [Branchiostoma lanceolatum]|uniref:Nitric oxide synthase n=1 Tax=Branchiostoma lanceolatum TaxID=7740 RepID=A0A8J9ZKR1_BRALA|nr:NOS1 [Branchiostoma lanceolatum]
MECRQNIIVVKLVIKDPADGLGISLKPRAAEHEKVVIEEVIRGGPADQTGMVQPGDTILAVNGQDIEYQYQEATKVIRDIEPGKPVELVLRGPKWFHTYLETVRLSTGETKTVRVTRPNGPIGALTLLIQRVRGNTFGRRAIPKHDIQGDISLQKTFTRQNDVIRTAANGIVANGCQVAVSKAATCMVVPTSTSRPVRLRNWLKEGTMHDTLSVKGNCVNPCNDGRCLGSLMRPRPFTAPGYFRPKEEVLEQAKKFIFEYFASLKSSDAAERDRRWRDVQIQVKEKGVYHLTIDELVYGAKMAWRNSSRCIGRIQWSKLQVFDARDVRTAREMFAAICRHIKWSTNGGNIRSAITVFPPRTDGRHDYKVWNGQFLKYAAYQLPDGSILGDPINLEFTEVCQALGWKGEGTLFDLLPMVLSANGEDPEWFDLPRDIVMEVNITHPKYDWFEELDIKWYCLPVVSNMLFDCGGLEFSAAPFSGWYMGTEVGRDLCDENRLNITETVGKRMGLDIARNSSLWKDAVLVQVNIAILHSFQSNNVTIIDHHTASENFIKHLKNEQRLRGGCPSDWVWIVPPMSASLAEVFHQEMANYHVRPSFEYQEDAWLVHLWRKKPKQSVLLNYAYDENPKRKYRLKEVALAVKFAAVLMKKALNKRVKTTILYATETGKSESFASSTLGIFKHAFDAKMMCMDEYDITNLEKEELVIVVTSTFGNGDPPDNGEEFGQALLHMKHPPGKMKPDSVRRVSSISRASYRRQQKLLRQLRDGGALGSVRYTVFALGSSAYLENYCAFGHAIDTLFESLGAERIQPVGEGDELCRQEESFRAWVKGAFKSACERFDVGHDVDMEDVKAALLGNDFSWAPGKFRIVQTKGLPETDILEGLSKLHRRKVVCSTVISKTQLQAPESSRQTCLVQLETHGAQELKYVPGDHVAVFPANEDRLVQAILDRVEKGANPDAVIQIEALQEKKSGAGFIKTWTPQDRLPTCSLRTALSRYLDVTTPPSPQLLLFLAMHAASSRERAELEALGKGGLRYEDWKFEAAPTLPEVLQHYPSLQVPPALLLSQLPVLQQRYYSISSSPHMYPGQIHATVAVVKYRTRGGQGPEHSGVCSNWLNTIKTNESVPCYIRTAKNFHLPENSSLPVLMVGSGTGIAPLRSFWQQRQVDIKAGTTSRHPPGDMTLVFGCRQSRVDHIYKEETAQARRDGALTDLYTALSREPGTNKTYVQDILRERIPGKVLDLVLKDGGHIYVCGDVTMATDVGETVQRILREHGGMSVARAEDFINNMKDSNRYHEDIFGVFPKTREAQGAVRKGTLRTSGRTSGVQVRAAPFWQHYSCLS